MPTITAEQLRQAATQFYQTPHPQRDGVVCDCEPTLERLPSRIARRCLTLADLVPEVWLRHDAECSYATWARSHTGAFKDIA